MTVKNKREILEEIQDNIKNIINSEYYNKWKNEKVKGSGYVIFNNSFLNRENLAFTKKSNKYLGFEIFEDRKEIKENINELKIFLLKTLINEDIKFYSKKHRDLPEIKNIESVIDEELEKIGYASFILIGELKSHFKITESDNFIIIYDSNLSKDYNICYNGKIEIRIKRNVERELLLNEIVELIEHDENLKSKRSWEREFKEEYKKIFYELNIPTKETKKHNNTLIGSIKNHIKNQNLQYKNYLEKFKDNEENNENLMEIKRIAYNFATDALKVMRLILVICDLHPIILWLTLFETLKLKKFFEKLFKTSKKPNLEEYKRTISKSRNKSFHNFFNFDMDIRVNLEEINFKGKELRLFKEYGKNNKLFDSFKFEDREIIETFLTFSRTNQDELSTDFWENNYKVMDEFYVLVEKTEEVLWMLNSIKK
ncbi:hypothetical protein [Marinitoga sp. 1155]|uniref:hypothetical protein n=1 Tax=Marinitoga sp. 1155 TaxID=1428448 RepID=UPI0006410FA2|nr:hypothetical protein [Marinitoga sp. 1155]KLO22775.1 hypothetical protein X274_07740 [Marinitoga sp. 1155]